MAKTDAAERVEKPQEVTGADNLFGDWNPETAGDKPFKVLLYGASGSGKTYMAGTFPRPIFLDLEDGMRTLLPMGRKVLRYPKDPKQVIRTFGEVRRFWKLLADTPPAQAPFDTIVIDSMNELQKLVLDDVLSKFQQNRMYEDQPTMTDYGKLARDMQKCVRWFIQLPYNVVFTCIAMEREFDDSRTRPLFIGKKTGPDVEKMMDIIGYCHTIQPKKGEPVQHVVGFEDNPSYLAKDRTGKLGSIVSNTFEAMTKAIAKEQR